MTNHFDSSAYGPIVQSLLASDRLPDLGPGTPISQVKGVINSLTVAGLFVGRPLIDETMARCCLAGLWLHHDFLNESHAISQEIETTTGSYWHAIMHRRE